MKQTKQQLVELVTDLKSKLQLANEQHDNVVDELNKLRSSCVSKSTYDELFLDHQSKCDDYNTLNATNEELKSSYDSLYEDCELHIKKYNDCTDKYKILESSYDKLNADKAKQIDNLTDQIRKLEHDNAGCITREQYGKLEVQLASAKQNYDDLNEEYNKIKCDYVTLKDHSVSIDEYNVSLDASKHLTIENKAYAASNADLYQKVADMNKSNKWLKISLVTSVVMLIASLVW